ncbi:DUF5134 domain-containing protein [Streptomyces leeuwenhoekii]|uniref:Membrane protein n=1 Tax=Streptomyces leeuwenhoekii TaxID=1437453 RepID=A0A0F7W0F0_STRLW|nr:DUF5134 domain-containing protein [Streptomyces leeuwenhoekii]KMS79214.1 membrane protein [Streptomyces leeuwenhoekii]CQR65470.1 Integral Membrane Protein [Streptomyces leeuwenhoekii]
MHTGGSSGWALVALCAAAGAYCLLRMRGGAGEQRREAGGEALMGFGMAAMAVPPAVFSPPPWTWALYAAVFGAAGLHALWAARDSPHHLHHLVGAGAMVYMAVVMAGSPAHAQGHGHGGSGAAPLTGALLLYFAGYVLLGGARLVPVAAVPADGPAPGQADGWTGRPELARACRLSMGIAMLAMLLTL